LKDDQWVQESGPKNSLGLVKFDMQDKEAIYLHDTPAKAIFGMDDRHRSHGCVRVENAVQFATAIAEQEGVLDQFQEALRNGSFVKLTLSAPRGPDRSLKQIQIRSIELRGAAQLSFVYHHKDRDITKNFPWDEGISLLTEILGRDFRNAHLFTTRLAWQLEIHDGGGLVRIIWRSRVIASADGSRF